MAGAVAGAVAPLAPAGPTRAGVHALRPVGTLCPGAATEPASLEAALSHLDEDGGAGAPGVAGTAAAAAAGGVGGAGGAGSGYPDLSSLLRARRGESTQVQGSEALLPYRPYKWLQWLGGLGPLLTSRVKSSQPVLEALVQAVSTAAASGPKGSAGPTRKRK